MANLQIVNTVEAYNLFLNELLNIFDITLGSQSPRLVVTETDGTVIYDTAAGDRNTYQNWKSKTINENHNTRVAIMTAQMFDCGVGYETKYSSTVGTNQNYVAIRAGPYLNSAGTFRLSYNSN